MGHGDNVRALHPGVGIGEKDGVDRAGFEVQRSSQLFAEDLGERCIVC